jgi:polar amino acid transport system substrate-binding protein
MRRAGRIMPALLGAWAVAAGVGACGGTSTPTASDAGGADSTTTTAPSVQTTPTTLPECDETASYPPAGPPDPDALRVDDVMRDIESNRVLIVGVDENTLGLAYRNTDDGEIKGMEIDLASEIAHRIFGDDVIVELVPVTTDEKFDAVADGRVHLTIDAASMSCGRWERVDFSTEYVTAEQQFLVRSDSPIESANELTGRTVCVTAGSSSALIMQEHAPQAELLEVDLRGDCLMALQQGRADAYFGHDTFLQGMVVQDPTMGIRTTIDLSTDDTVSHYGIAIADGHVEFVQIVNWALEEMRADGTLKRLHKKWLEAELGMPRTYVEPVANHTRELP